MIFFRYLIPFLLFFASCHSMKFEIAEGTQGRVVKQRKAFFLFGVAPTREVDLGAICPEGTLSVAESTSFLDGFLGLVTIGIYTPRSSTYVCKGGN